MTKEELASENKSLKEQIQNLSEKIKNDEHELAALETLKIEKKYLAEAVDAKNKEITKTREECNRKILEFQQSKDSEINVNFETQKRTMETEHKLKMHELQETNKLLEERVKELEEFQKRRVDELNKFIFAHGSLIKQIQGAIETATAYNDVLVESAVK